MLGSSTRLYNLLLLHSNSSSGLSTAGRRRLLNSIGFEVSVAAAVAEAAV